MDGPEQCYLFILIVDKLGPGDLEEKGQLSSAHKLLTQMAGTLRTGQEFDLSDDRSKRLNEAVTLAAKINASG